MNIHISNKSVFLQKPQFRSPVLREALTAPVGEATLRYAINHRLCESNEGAISEKILLKRPWTI